MYDSIFSPSFGNRPQTLIGRDETIKALVEGLRSRPGSKDRSILILGQRGMGKTVLLLELAEQAKKADYITISPTVTIRGMLNRILEKIRDSANEILKPDSGSFIGGSIEIMGFGAGIQLSDVTQPPRSFAAQLSDLCRQIESHGKRLLLLIDEVRPEEPELRELVVAFQEMVGEGHDLALVMAGLPSAISTTLNDKVLTFLNRSRKVTLDPLKIGIIRAYYKEAFTQLNIYLPDNLRQDAARQTQGSPYLMQLIGHYIVHYTLENGQIDQSSYQEAIETAKDEYNDDICKTILNNLSGKDIAFLAAMAKDEGSSRTKALAERLGKSPQYVQQYRSRLLGAGVIESTGYGEVSFAVPYLKDYLRQRKE